MGPAQLGSAAGLPLPSLSPSGRIPTETLSPGAGVMESVTLKDVAMGLIQEWALLDDAWRNLCRYMLLDNCRTLAPRAGAPPCKASLVSQVGPRKELRAAEGGILQATCAGLHLKHAEVLRLRVELELQLLAHATATTIPDPSHIYNLHRSLSSTH